MNAPLRRVGVVAMVLFGLLFANLNFVQWHKANDYRTSQYNGRVQVAEYDRQRGVIQVSGKPGAQSITTEDNLKFLRQYPYKAEFAHVIGYKPVNGEATGIEYIENEFLAGTSDQLFADRLRDLWSNEKTPGGNVVTTLSLRAQQTAYKELLNNANDAKVGSVVALDPTTGAVLAMVSTPSYDPNLLVSHDTKAANAAYDRLASDPSQPLLNRAVKETYAPGSIFKVIDSAAALERGYTMNTSIPAGSSYTAPGTTHAIKNAAPSICPEAQVTLIEALTESCNTGFAQLGVALGPQALTDTAESFGFGDDSLRVGQLGKDNGILVAPSQVGRLTTDSGGPDQPIIAQTSIGQADARVTPMQAALMAATVANGGVQMRPYLVQQLLGPDLTPYDIASPRQLRTACTQGVAQSLQAMMVSVVENGTAKKAQIDGYVVGGKTGTAQNAENAKDHGWFIGFAMKDGKPLVAVAVLLANAGSGGSGEAARIGGQVMKAVIADRGGK
ncbi:MAG: penicillin-binding protein 2 [Hamadaea sp.]|uniref:peptidoglycan D,D-transpeptidase FtsI family protein n=1 Tax=Hamadaea sp. NPDC050747 TaxID=3155789 RepID=UPI001851E15E|nr:penicillin-binding protein 2 [Hamadaea sp.]